MLINTINGNNLLMQALMFGTVCIYMVIYINNYIRTLGGLDMISNLLKVVYICISHLILCNTSGKTFFANLAIFSFSFICDYVALLEDYCKNKKNDRVDRTIGFSSLHILFINCNM